MSKKQQEIKEPLPSPDTPLTQKQVLFCQLYAWVIGDSFGNATISYMGAYGCTYKSAEANGSRMIGNDNICRYITKLYGERLTPEVVDAELSYVLLQRHDLSSKMRAISEYNKIQGRIKQSDSWMAPIMHEFYMGIVNAVEKNRLKELPQGSGKVVIEQ